MPNYSYKKKKNVFAERWMGTSESEVAIKNLGALIELQEQTGHLFVSTRFGVALAPIGHWIVRDGDLISVWSPVDFAIEFTEGVGGER